MARPGDREVLPCGEIRTTRDAQGRLTGALYALDGRTYGWRLEIDPAAGVGRFISPDRSEEQRWEGPGLAGFVERCLVDIRDTGYVQVARTATRAFDAGELDQAERLFRAFEQYARGRPGAYNQGALSRIIATAALVKAARGVPGSDVLVATALAAALVVDEKEEKGTAALGKRMKRTLGDRYPAVLLRAAATGLGVLASEWSAADQESRWHQLDALRERIQQVAGDDGLAALAEAAAARDGDEIARLAREIAAARGEDEADQPTIDDGIAIADLNNQANALMHEGSYEQADELLADVARRLAADGSSDRQSLIDEYFYCGNLAELRWRQGRYRDAVGPAERAYELERRIADLHRAFFSNTTWAIISIYTRLGRIDDAERVFESELADPERLAARRAADPEAIENAFNAGMCIYSENKTPEKMARGRRLFDLLCQRIPVPSSVILTWCYACNHGYYGEEEKAREFLERAIAMGASRAELRNDPDFDPVRERPWFRQLLA